MKLIEILKAQQQPKSKRITKKPLGFVLFETTEIVVIATFESKNIKTGNMIQISTLVKNVDPVTASKIGLDSLVCGNCKQRQSLGGGCYVNLGQFPLTVYKTYKAGKYKSIDDVPNWLSLFVNREVRFGAYGDPVYIPKELIAQIAAVSSGWTGYTHQWETNNWTKDYFMASVDNNAEGIEAKELGFRYFKTVLNLDYDLDSKEIVCPNTTNGILCSDCKLCDGTNKSKAKNIVILAHGSWKNRFAE